MLTRIRFSGFKSIKSLDLSIEPMNILLGENGSGKSNFIKFFQMLNMMMTGNLQLFTSRQGGANSILHYGAKVTQQIDASLEFKFPDATTTYSFRLAHGAPDTFVYLDEQVSFHKKGFSDPRVVNFGSGHKESALDPDRIQDEPTARVTRSILSGCRMYQFHDTSPEAHVRQKCRVDDSRSLKSNGGNLAAVLFRLQREQRDAFDQITAHVQRIVSHFDQFVFDPEGDSLLLRWREKESDTVFDVSQMSDGSIRAISILTLLSLPPNESPKVIVIDEPELGLHPAATSILCELLQEKSKTAKVIVATQSMQIAKEFGLFDAVICERSAKESDISRRSPADVDGWADTYSLGELWANRKIGAWR